MQLNCGKDCPVKPSTLFAIAACVMVILGLIVSYVPSMPRFTIPRSYGLVTLPPEVLCYLLAGIFCAVAFIESISYIPLSKTMVEWHSWMSIGSTTLFGLGISLWFCLMYKPPELTQRFTLAILGPILISLPIFVVAQAWFCAGLVYALLKMRA